MGNFLENFKSMPSMVKKGAKLPTVIGFVVVFIMIIYNLISSGSGLIGFVESIEKILSWASESSGNSIIFFLVLLFIMGICAIWTLGSAERETQKLLTEIKSDLSKGNSLTSLHREQIAIIKHIASLDSALHEFLRIGGEQAVVEYPISSFNRFSLQFGGGLDHMEAINSASYANRDFPDINRIREQSRQNYRRFMAEYNAVIPALQQRLRQVERAVRDIEVDMADQDNADT